MRLVLALAAVAALSLNAQTLSGRRAPSFSLPDSTLKQHDILDYRGKWLLVDFMRTDCPHCKALSKVLEQAKAHYGDKIALLAVVIAPPENQNTVAQYIRENKLTSTAILFDQGQVAVSFFKATPSNPSFDTPHLFVINPSGIIVRDWGYSPATQEILEGKGLAPQLDSLFAGK